MGIFSSDKTETVEKKKPLFDEEAREKARQTRLANKVKAQEDAKLLAELKIAAENFEREKRDWAQEKKELETKHRVALEKKDTDIEILTEKVEVLEEMGEASNQIRKDKYRIEKKDAMLTAREEALDDFEEEIKKVKEQNKVAEETGYKRGYADGVSDGVRKGAESSAEDRKMLAQVAMLSAASHTPEAAATIAKEIKNALPATTGTKNK